mmetsp:Transcript_16774/g.32737  ORF Transcript_16774/g.32737 Transcript_16774/m.32737 type:complete len:107 (+) Transcript_16774:424-744(+)
MTRQLGAIQILPAAMAMKTKRALLVYWDATHHLLTGKMTKKLNQSINTSGESSKMSTGMMHESDGESKMSSEGNNNITETALQRKKADRLARLRRWKETRLELSEM